MWRTGVSVNLQPSAGYRDRIIDPLRETFAFGGLAAGSYVLQAVVTDVPQLSNPTAQGTPVLGSPPRTVVLTAPSGEQHDVDLGLTLVPTPHDERYFPATGYRIDNDEIWAYFQARGGVDTFGYPVSRGFPFLGFWTQLFQRQIIQIGGLREPGAHPMNLLDPGLLPITSVNGSTVPAHDPAVASAAPPPGTPDYGVAVETYLRATVPDTWEGEPVGFLRAYLGAAPAGSDLPALVALVWGFPTSQPARDPTNAGFVYQRFQRGILHYDATTGATGGLLLADTFKSVLTGEALPPDVATQMATSPFFRGYEPAALDGLAPDKAPLIRNRGIPTSLAFAFVPETP